LTKTNRKLGRLLSELPKVVPLHSLILRGPYTNYLRVDVESKKTTLVEIVQSLGEYINDDDPLLRGKAISYLTAVIRALPAKFLTRQQVQVLTTFFCDRVEDGGAVAGLETLQKLDRFTKEMAAEVATA
jgi:DNA repair/transcription protein MET18/MMS19